MEEKTLMVIYDSNGIINTSEFIEGTGIYMPVERGVIIDKKSKIISMLSAIGITDFRVWTIIKIKNDRN